MKLNLWKPLLAASFGLAMFTFAATLAAQEEDEAQAQDKPAQPAEDEPATEEDPAEEGPADEPKDEEAKPDAEALQKQIMELRARLQALIQEGKLDEAKELQGEMLRLHAELAKARLGGGPGGAITGVAVPLPPPGEFPGGGFGGGAFGGGGIGGFPGQPLDKEQAEKQIAGLKAAAEELRKAGLDARAEQMEREAKMIERMLEAPPRPVVAFGGAIGGGPELAKTIEDLQAQVKELAQAVKDLQAQVKELSGRSEEGAKESTKEGAR